MDIRGFGTAQSGLGSSSAPNMSFQVKWGADIDYISLKTNSASNTLSMEGYFKHLCFKYSQLSVLQIGAENGNGSVSILRMLTDKETRSVKRYDLTYTSIQPSIQTRKLFQDWINLIHFRKLDIEHDPVNHGFARHYYDLVITNGFFLTKSYLDTAITNIHKLLKPGGRLVVIAEDRSLLFKDQLHDSLLRCSFNGVELSIGDDEAAAQTSAMVTSKAVITDPRLSIYPIKIIANEGTEGFAFDISLAFKSAGFEASISTWSADLSNNQVIDVIVDNGGKAMFGQSKFRTISEDNPDH